MGGRISGEEVLVHYLQAELFATESRWTPAKGDGGYRFFGYIQELAAIG
jgi:hypothetical protein